MIFPSRREGRRSKDIQANISMKYEVYSPVHRITHDAAIVLRRIHNLGIFRPDDFTPCCDHTQLACVDFDNCTFRQDAKLGVHWTLRILLYSDDGQLESCLMVML